MSRSTPPERVAEMLAAGYMMQELLADKFRITKMTLYNWERSGKLKDPTEKRRQVSVKKYGNRWFLIDAVAAQVASREAAR